MSRTKAALHQEAASWLSARVSRRPGSSSSKEPEFFFVFFFFPALGSPSGERVAFSPSFPTRPLLKVSRRTSALRLRTRGCESSTFFRGLPVLLALQPDVLRAQLAARSAARRSSLSASLNF